MLGDISLATNIYLVTGYTDMRKSIDGLCAIIMNDIVNIGLHFFLKNVRPYAAFCCEA